MSSLRYRFIIFIYIGYQFPAYERLIPVTAVNRTVEIPTAKTAIGAYENNLQFVCFVFKLRSQLWPLSIVAAIAVEQINDGERIFGLFMAGRGYDNAFNVLFHAAAENCNGIGVSGMSGKG